MATAAAMAGDVPRSTCHRLQRAGSWPIKPEIPFPTGARHAPSACRIVPPRHDARPARRSPHPAADWSDTALGWRAGRDFREPFNPGPIHKNIFSLTHASGYRIGNQFLSVDVLQSDHRDPARLNRQRGATEIYLLYRYTFDLGKLAGRDLAFGPVRGLGLTLGADLNWKRDVAYNSRKRMAVLGPQVMWNVPGRLNTALLLVTESNAPTGPFPPISTRHGQRYTYDPYPMLAIDWGIPLGERWTFEGFANWIGSKGRNETGAATGAETNIDARLMFDAGRPLGARAHAFQLGIEYQYWRNKFGNTRAGTGSQGYIASTPMLRAEYRF